MSALSVAEVLARCALTRTWSVGMCGQFCAVMYGYGFSGYRDAVTQWNETPSRIRHAGATDAPPGALVYWSGGSAGHGHVAISDGLGGVWSIDIGGPGTVSRVPAGTITSRWGLPYLGWARPYFQEQEWQPVAIYGTDVSGYQPINFALSLPETGRRVDFAIIKITEGISYVNPKWTAQRQWARDHDLSVGFYHFARPGSMVDQADFFLSRVALQPGDHLWFDWEDAGVSGAQKDAWISYVQGRAPDHRVGLYCNTSFWKTRDTTSFAGDGLWIATGDIPAGDPPITSPWLIHQYSTAGGYDHDIAQFASKADMIDWARKGEDMAFTPEDKTWLKAEIRTALKELVYSQVWDQDRMVPPAGEDTPENPKWKPQSLVRYAGERAADAVIALEGVLAQSRFNGSTLTEIKTILAGLDLSGLPEAVAAKLATLRLKLEEETTS
jgi:GH25 family lysozyme M1 (1,4-beta-N-acetylmuramidase)